MSATEDPFESIESAVAGSSRDQSIDKRDAWIYGIVLGWGSAMKEVAALHGWDDGAVARLRRLRAKWMRSKRK